MSNESEALLKISDTQEEFTYIVRDAIGRIPDRVVGQKLPYSIWGERAPLTRYEHVARLLYGALDISGKREVMPVIFEKAKAQLREELGLEVDVQPAGITFTIPTSDNQNRWVFMTGRLEPWQIKKLFISDCFRLLLALDPKERDELLNKVKSGNLVALVVGDISLGQYSLIDVRNITFKSDEGVYGFHDVVNKQEREDLFIKPNLILVAAVKAQSPFL